MPRTVSSESIPLQAADALWSCTGLWFVCRIVTTALVGLGLALLFSTVGFLFAFLCAGPCGALTAALEAALLLRFSFRSCAASFRAFRTYAMCSVAPTAP